MAWVSLNDVFVNKAGGSISGNLSVDGSLTINSGKGDGSTYNVATQLTNLNNNKAAASHTHSATDITKGTLSLDHLPTIPVSKGGTGATTASGALTNLGAASAQALKNLQDSVSSDSGIKYLYGSASSDSVAYRKRGYIVEMKWNFLQQTTTLWDPPFLPNGYRPIYNLAGSCVCANSSGSPTNNIAYYEVRTTGNIRFSVATALSGGRNIGHCVFLAA